MFLRLLFTLLLSVGSAYGASVEDRAISETAQRTNYTVSEVRETLKSCDRDERSLSLCAEHSFVLEDEKLKERYRDQLARVRGSSFEKPFISAQQAWVRFRDLDCEYEASGVEGGSMHGQWVLNCKRERTIERIRNMDAFLNCTDNGCPSN